MHRCHAVSPNRLHDHSSWCAGHYLGHRSATGASSAVDGRPELPGSPAVTVATRKPESLSQISPGPSDYNPKVCGTTEASRIALNWYGRSEGLASVASAGWLAGFAARHDQRPGRLSARRLHLRLWWATPAHRRAEAARLAPCAPDHSHPFCCTLPFPWSMLVQTYICVTAPAPQPQEGRVIHFRDARRHRASHTPWQI